jgi:hypothetical protein
MSKAHPVIERFHAWVRANDPGAWGRMTRAHETGGRAAFDREFNAAFAASQASPATAAAGLMQAVERHNARFH